MRTSSIAVLGVACYALFVVVLTPAAFVAARVNAASAGRVELQHAGGSLWQGSAKARIAVPAGWFDIDALEWRFAPSRLVAGRIAFDVKASAPGFDVHCQLARGFSDWEVRDAAGEAQASVLAALYPLAPTWRPEGRFLAAASALRWDDERLHGQASIEWRDAAVSLSEVKPLGNYRVDARADDSPARLVLITLQGPLRIAGEGRFMPPSVLTFSGEARGDKALEPLLDLMGPKRPDGARSIELRMR